MKIRTITFQIILLTQQSHKNVMKNNFYLIFLTELTILVTKLKLFLSFISDHLKLTFTKMRN